jgi:integrase
MQPPQIRPSSILFLTLFLLFTSTTCSHTQSLICTRVVDGDTIILSNGEKVRLISVDTPETVRPNTPVEIALYSGMRLTEVRLLEKDRVDLKAKYPSIYVHRTKSGKPKRIIMNETLTGLLKEAIKDSSKDSNYVFVNPKTGKPYTSIKTTFKKAIKRAGLENFKFHHTRHSFASRMLEAGVPEVTIMELGGWKTRNMINRYAHPSDAHKHEAMKTLDFSRTNSRTTFFREKEKETNSL